MIYLTTYIVTMTQATSRVSFSQTVTHKTADDAVAFAKRDPRYNLTYEIKVAKVRSDTNKNIGY